MKNFSLILNTRNRVATLENFLRSVFEKTNNIDSIEVLINYDYDDEDSHQFFLKFKDRYNFVRSFSIPRPNNLHIELNKLAKISIGRFVFGLNDDVEILTKDWDKIALETIETFKKEHLIKDDIIYASPKDTSVDKSSGKGYASFPIISREAIDTLGFFMYEDFVGLGGDSSIYRVYEAVGRVVDLEITLDHVFHNSLFKVFCPDLTAAEMRRNSSVNPVDPFLFDISKEIDKLKQVI